MARMRRVNVDGVIHTIRAVARGMQERGYGRIVNIASNAAIGTALPATTFYAATKAADRCSSPELAPDQRDAAGPVLRARLGPSDLRCGTRGGPPSRACSVEHRASIGTGGDLISEISIVPKLVFVPLPL